MKVDRFGIERRPAQQKKKGTKRTTGQQVIIDKKTGDMVTEVRRRSFKNQI